ncbi:hypothetical protein Tco_0266263 [Tanacetum coccineum]
MALSIADQIALDDALVAPADRLKIGKCNLRLSSDITSKEATLQVVYDVLKLTPFYKAFQVTADAPEIYMQEFWASAYVHNRSVRFKMNNKKHIIGLEQFRDILQICPKVGNKKFVDPPLETEIIIFLASLGHSGDIRKLSDVNVNKLHQPWRSFAAVINKCLCGTPSYDSLRLSQAQILWGMYNKKSVDYAYLLWEDFIFKIETKSSKKGSAMYYPRFTKIVVNYVMEKDPSIPRRNKVNWHYARDDPMFTTINVISRNEVTQLYGAILPVALTNEDIRNSESYKEYYAMASGTIPPKTKGSKKKANTDAIPKRKPSTAPKKQKTGTGKQKTSELENISEADLTEAEQLKIVIKRSRQETHSSHASGSGADEGTGVYHQGFPMLLFMIKIEMIYLGKEEDDDDHDDDENDQEDDDARDDDKKAEDDDDEEMTESDNDGSDEDDSSISSSDEDDSDNDVEGAKVAGAKSAIVEPSFNRPPTPHPIVIQTQQPPILTPATTTSSLLQNLPDFASLFGFDHRLKALEDNFSELRQTNQYAEALSSIPSTVEQYLANKMQEAVDVAVQLKYDRIREESTSANQQFLDTIDDGMKKIIKDQVKKEVSKVIPKIEKLVTDQLESEVLMRSSKEANTSHAVAANLSELELKKILIDKMETNNSINRSDIQRQLYKDLVEAYEADKILLDTYGDTVTIKRPRDGADDDEEPSAGTDRGSKRRRSGKEPASTSAPSETTTKTAGQTTSTGTKTHTKSASQSAPVGDAMHSTDVFKGPADQEFETGVQDEQAEEEVQHLPDWFQKPTRPPSPDHAWNKSTSHNEKLDWINPEGRHIRTICGQPLPLFPNSSQFSDDDALYKFKEGDLHRLRIQDIEDMLLLLVQGKVTNLSVEERIAFNIKSEKTRRLYSILRSKDSTTNKDKKNRLMRIDELHKFSDGTLDDVRTALNDRLKGIRMEYLPQTFWNQRDKANARAMIQAIDKRLKTRRIMRSLERFVGGRPYGDDLRLLQRTI